MSAHIICRNDATRTRTSPTPALIPFGRPNNTDSNDTKPVTANPATTPSCGDWRGSRLNAAIKAAANSAASPTTPEPMLKKFHELLSKSYFRTVVEGDIWGKAEKERDYAKQDNDGLQDGNRPLV